MATPRLNHWLLRIVDQLRTKEDEVPEGWECRDDISKKIGLKVTQANTLLRKALAAGLVERQTFRRLCGKKLHHIPYYRPTGTAQAKPTRLTKR